MPVIGTFSAVKDGYAGTIRTLTMNTKVRIVANDRKETRGAPDFRIMAGSAEIGAAWRRTKQGTDETYLRVQARRPGLAAAGLGRAARGDRGRRRPPRLAPRPRTTASGVCQPCRRQRMTDRPVEQRPPPSPKHLSPQEKSNVARGAPSLCVLLPFAAGYYLSYLFRSINALIAGDLMAELGLSAGRPRLPHRDLLPGVRGRAAPLRRAA